MPSLSGKNVRSQVHRMYSYLDEFGLVDKSHRKLQ